MELDELLALMAAQIYAVRLAKWGDKPLPALQRACVSEAQALWEAVVNRKP